MTDEKQIDGTTHAEKDANGDIVHKPNVVDTEEVNIDSVATGTSRTIVGVPGALSNQHISIITQITEGVTDGSTTTIVELDPDTGDGFADAGHVTVSGVDQNDTSNIFVDTLGVTRGDAATVFNSHTRGSPQSRSYAVSGGILTLEMGGSGEDYTVDTLYYAMRARS